MEHRRLTQNFSAENTLLSGIEPQPGMEHLPIGSARIALNSYFGKHAVRDHKTNEYIVGQYGTETGRRYGVERIYSREALVNRGQLVELGGAVVERLSTDY